MRRSKEFILDQYQFKKVHPELMRRLFALADRVIALGGDYGFGSGRRSHEVQFQTFRSRYFRVASGSSYDINWNTTPNPIYYPYLGLYRKYASASPSTPPYWSYHEDVTANATEYALAVDMVGRHDIANPLANSYGLSEFSKVNNEPWHYQPIEVTRSRRSYTGNFENPAPWPLPGTNNPPPLPPPIPDMSSIQVTNPIKIFDSRPDQPVVQHNPHKGTFVIVSLFPHGFTSTNADGVILNLTGIGTHAGFFTLWSGEGGAPNASNLNVMPGQIENNLAFVPLFSGGFGVFSTAPNHLIIDQVGWYET